MPKLMVTPGSDEDWSHLFAAENERERARLDGIFATFQKNLADLSKECDAYDAAANERPFPMNAPLHVLNPKNLETSVSI